MALDSETQGALRARFNPDGSKLRINQLRMLDILIEVDAVCRRHDIDYWLSSGTLIGAARHSGFIPWDDDLDIEMLLPDYQRFCEIAPRELPPHLLLHNSSNDPMFLLGLCKVRDSRFPIVSANQKLEQHYLLNGLFIDIIPLEPSTSFLLHRISGKIAYWSALIVNKAYGSKLIKAAMYSHKAVAGTLRLLNRLFQPLHPGSRLRHVFPSTFPKPRYKEDLFPLSEIQFEGHTFRCPRKVDSYLSKIYGNWLSLPDLNRIILHTRCS